MKCLLILLSLFSSICFADPKFKKDSCVKFYLSNYGDCSGETKDVKTTTGLAYFYTVSITTCSSLYGEGEIIHLYQSDLKSCGGK